MIIWTRSYQPFRLGGGTEINIKTDVPQDCVSGPYELGKGFKGYIVTAPNGRSFVTDMASGGIIGDTLDAVRYDVETGDHEVMTRQVMQAIGDRDAAEMTPVDRFWAMLRVGPPPPTRVDLLDL